ncbi:cell division topological specificity factor MinE [Clostridium intestinale]|uniref:Cell division topological specificity factor n=1 Tax=Clostridium intestinale URNW TaxID=1294142 RepID=U2NSC0_9CLOT|nr:cell division topological specificity factor MinE [Clostridium intestinale]ERK31761.1 cell division topological specificity factor MinE [Clostridium intestinale URNW]
MKNFYNKTSSKEVASKRLKLILINDRDGLSLELLEKIKSEVIMIIAKYVEIHNTEVELKIIKNSSPGVDSSILVANIPIKVNRYR